MTGSIVSRLADPVAASGATASTAKPRRRILTDEQLEHFKREGYLVVPGMFAAQVEAYLQELDTWLQAHLGHTLDSRKDASPGGAFVEMFFGKAKELLWQSEAFDQMWTELFTVYKGDVPGFEHSQGAFDPEEKFLFPDRVCVRQPQTEQRGTHEHMDFNIYDNQYKPDAAPFISRKAKDEISPLPAWRPIQCSVAITGCGAAEGNFRCAPGWHLKMNDWTARIQELEGADTRPGYMADMAVTKLRCPGLERHRALLMEIIDDFVDVPANAGDVIVWDARIPHAAHNRHTGHELRIVDFNCRIPATEANRAFAVDMWQQYSSMQLHPPTYPKRFATLEEAPLDITGKPALVQKILGAVDAGAVDGHD